MKYAIGVDFGTLSARALLVRLDNGEEIADAVSPYEHAVMDEALPSQKKLPRAMALQMPKDYINSLSSATKEVLKKSGVNPCDVIGLGIDFTASTVLPVDENGTPMCEKEEYTENPHAYVKLWKHHSAENEAREITELAKKRGEPWLSSYGGKISAELALPKILETARSAPKLYADTFRFTEAADWLSLVLTGKETRSPAFAGYKYFWNQQSGYPENDFFRSLDPMLDGIVGTKLPKEVNYSINESAGLINELGAEITGLCEGTALALPMIDAHASMAGLNITGDGDIVMIIGTSTCHVLNSEKKSDVSGIFGYVKDGVIPGLYTYEAGQSGVGDMFDWFVKNSIPSAYEKEASEKGVSINKLLGEKASLLKIGESGLIALDWFSGNRSILADSSLTGMICGLTLKTKPEEIYRALLEATAFGARVIFEQYENFGIKIGKVTAAGGISGKDELMMQIYADVLKKDVHIAASALSGALGSAVYAAAAGGAFPSIKAASQALAKPAARVFHPIEENSLKYDILYEKYKSLHDYFGKNKD